MNRLLLVLLVLLAGCAKDMHVDRVSADSLAPGIRYSAGVPFLIVTDTGSQIKMLPDASQTYAVTPGSTTIGVAELSVELTDGMLSKISSKNDKKVAETVQGVAAIAGALGGFIKSTEGIKPGVYKIDVATSKLIPVTLQVKDTPK